MNLTMLMKFGENITADTPMGEKAVFGLQVVGIGMGVVFGVLILLIGILQLFKLSSLKKSTVETKTETVATPVASAPQVASVASVASVPASEEEQLVAIATAAIAASRGESECAFNVISIKKIVK